MRDDDPRQLAHDPAFLGIGRRPEPPPLPPGPPDPPRQHDTRPDIEPVTAVGGVGNVDRSNVDRWGEPEPARRDLYSRTAWIERMAWRNAFLIMFVIGVLAYAFEWLALPFAAALALGGLVPGLFLLAREQYERTVEAERAAFRPETRHDGTLPPLRRTVTRPADLDD